MDEEILDPILDPETEATSVSTVTKTSVMPRFDSDIISTAQKVSAKLKESGLTLSYITIEQFDTLSAEFAAKVYERSLEGARKMPLTNRLSELDSEIASSLRYVKTYIAEKYGEEAVKSYLAVFGISRQGNNTYSFPSDRQKRLASLKLMINALQTEEMLSNKYGYNYWLPIYDEYESLLNQTQLASANISKIINDRDALKNSMTEVLRSVVYLLKAHYPSAYRLKLREWGYLKENL